MRGDGTEAADDGTEAAGGTAGASAEPAAEAPSAGAETDEAATASAAELQPVTIAVNRNLLFVPVWVAQEQGFFEAEGLDAELVELTGGGAEIRTAVLFGAVDATVQVPEGSALVYQQGQRLVNIVVTQSTVPWRLVLSQELEGSVEPGDVAALEGLTIGVTGRGAGSDVFLQALLRSVGLEPDADVTIAAYGGPWASALTAIEEGQMDGAMIVQPGVAPSREVAFEFARISDGELLEGAEVMPGAMNDLHADPSAGVESGARIMTDSDDAFIETVVSRMVPKCGPELNEESWIPTRSWPPWSEPCRWGDGGPPPTSRRPSPSSAATSPTT